MRLAAHIKHLTEMHVTEIKAEEYKNLFKAVPHVFNSVEFSELNKHKAEAVSYLAFADGGKTKAGLILGERADGLYSPFSAPFGGFTTCGKLRLSTMDEIAAALKQYSCAKGKPVRVTLPPTVYDETQISKWTCALQRHGRLMPVNLNYHFDLSLFQRYRDVMERNARKNLSRAMREDLKLEALGSAPGGVERAYGVIRTNREEHGYPLRMTLQEVKDTVKTIRADFFVMTHGGTDVAAAQVFHVAEGTAQVIYWGDIKAYSHLRTMNMLAYSLFKHYYEQGLKTLDIGPSTEDGIPNNGLCDFKESIGCSVTPKFMFVL